MEQIFKKELLRHKLLIFSIAVSFILLIIFLVFQYYDLKILLLDIKWIILSGVPILIALFIDGYIKKFKGFGLELESNLSRPITLSIVSKVNTMESPAVNKATLYRLGELSHSEKSKIDRLRFISGKKNYYDEYAIDEHFRTLPNLKFIEIVNQEDEFLYLIQASTLKKIKTNARLNQELNIERVHELIKAIETENIEDYFKNAVKDFILTTDSLIGAYRKMKMSNQTLRLFTNREILPILNENKKMVGIVGLQNIESQIAAEVEKCIT